MVRLWREFRTAGLPAPLLHAGMRPHLTLAICDQAPEGLEHFASEWDALPVALGSVGTFAGDEGVVFLAPVVTLDMRALHDALYARMQGLSDACDRRYLPHCLVWHCTQSILLTEEELAATIAICRRAALPITGHIASIGLHETTLDPTRERYEQFVKTTYPAVFNFRSRS